MSPKMTADNSVSVNVCIIAQRCRTPQNKWSLHILESFVGEWNDLVYELYASYNQFSDEVSPLPRSSARHERLDRIAERLAKPGVPYEFMIPDGTDYWIVAYVKPVILYIEPDGSLL